MIGATMSKNGKIDRNIERKPGDIVCYVLIPTDLPSLREPNGKGSQGGKVGAHTHHAGVQMLKYANHPDVKAYLEDGKSGGADYYNTTIVLEGTLKQIETAVEVWRALGYVADKVVDPTYPWFVNAEDARFLDNRCQVIWDVKDSNGRVLVLREQLTCAWAIGDKTNDDVFRSVVANFTLAK